MALYNHLYFNNQFLVTKLANYKNNLYMNKLTATLLLCCLLGCSSFSYAQSADEKEIAAKVEMLRKALITPDKKALEDLVADDLSYGHSTGLVEDKAAFIDALVKGRVVLTSITLSYLAKAKR
jgi:hypothetical protein